MNLPEILQKLRLKMPAAIEKARQSGIIPYLAADGAFQPNIRITAWTNGFWPGTMWQMYRLTGEEIYRAEALRGEDMLDAAFADFENLSHDVGFIWKISSGMHYALEQDEKSLRRLTLAADLLAARFNPNGFIRAWNRDRVGHIIIDTLMNLPLLFAASRHFQDPRFRLMATAHAKTAQRLLQRPDGSVRHMAVLDPENGQLVAYPRGQGYSENSAWARGQAWAIYGFALCCQHTGDAAFLDASRQAADFFLAHLPADGLVHCDLCAPDEPLYYDDSGSMAAAAGLLCLSQQLGEREGAAYRHEAIRLIQATLTAHGDWSAENPVILQKSTAAYHADREHNAAIQYADFFLLDALTRLSGLEQLAW